MLLTNSPLTTHHSPLTTHHSPLTTHHNEVLHDLLQPPPKKGEPRQVLEVGEHPTLGVHVKGLLERPVRCETGV